VECAEDIATLYTKKILFTINIKTNFSHDFNISGFHIVVLIILRWWYVYRLTQLGTVYINFNFNFIFLNLNLNFIFLNLNFNLFFYI
jgi:hypothetical protein